MNAMEETEAKKEIVAREASEYAQMDLLLGDHKLFVDYSEKPFSHTAERFLRYRPEDAKLAVKFLAAGLSMRSIENRLNVSHHTLKELAFRKGGDIAEQRKHIAEICFGGGAVAMERVIELLPETKSAKDAAIAGGILLTKGMELSGQPTQRIEINAHIDFVAELKKLATDAKEEMKQVEGREIEDRQPEAAATV